MIEYLLDKLEELVTGRAEQKKERRLLVDDALRAVSIALNETQIYYARRDRGAPRSEDTELQLSRYWSAASVPLRHVDPNFASVCEHKSIYWLNPDDWDDARVEKYKIRLASVSKKVRRLRGFQVMSISKKGLTNR